MSVLKSGLRFSVAAIFVAAAFSAFGADTALERIKTTGNVNIGFRPGAVPFSYVLPEQEKPTGYAIAICNQVVEDLRKELKLPQLKTTFVAVDPKTRFTALDEGKIDMECANTTVTLDRRKKGYAFSIPYFITGSKVLVRSDVQANHIRDLYNKTVLVGEGTTTASMVKEKDNSHALGLKFLYFKKRAEAFALLEEMKADAMVEDTTVLLGFKANSKNPGGYKVIGDYLAVEPFAIMFKNDNMGLKVSADKTMRALMRGGDIVKLHKDWFETPIPPKNLSMDIPLGHLMKDMIRFPNDQVNAFP
jgi:ABC-type amino acid transport substrate-binding protein